MPVQSDESLTATLERLEILGMDAGTPGKKTKITDSGERWTQRKRDEIDRMLRQTKGDAPYTILNLNHFPLKINGGVYFYDEVPACLPGKPWAKYVIEKTRFGHKDNGCDAQNVMQMEPVPAMPSLLAGEYLREFKAVICYEGKADPATFKDDTVLTVPEGKYTDTGEFFVDKIPTTWGAVRAANEKLRNSYVLKSVQEANSNYENGNKNLVQEKERDLARHALELGLIKELPRWVLISNLEPELPAEPCPSCFATPNKGAILCVNCGQIFKVLEAFKNGRVKWDSDDMDRLTAEEWKEAEKIHAARQKARGPKTA